MRRVIHQPLTMNKPLVRVTHKPTLPTTPQADRSSSSVHSLSPPRPSRNRAGPKGGYRGIPACLGGARPAGTSRRRGPSVAVRGNPTVTPTVPTAPTPSAICPWFSGYSGTRRYKAARPGTDTKQPASQENPASGHIRRWWQVLGSNQRRLSRRFCSPSLLLAAPATDLDSCVSRRDLGSLPSATRP